MSYRLTFAEFEFLEKALRAIEAAGNEILIGESQEAIKKFYTGESSGGSETNRVRTIDTVGKVQRIREKLQAIAGT